MCSHLSAQHLLQTGIHLFLFDELTPVGVCNALAHGGAKAGVLKQSQSSVLHHSLGVGAFFGGDLGELGFLFWSEVYFHRFQNTEKAGLKQWSDNKRTAVHLPASAYLPPDSCRHRPEEAQESKYEVYRTKAS